MPDPILPAVELEPHGGPCDAAVIWLHGLGANGHDFPPIVPLLGLTESLKVRFVFPHAPSIPVTINGGYVMPAWYDLLGMELDSRQDVDGILRSQSQVEALIARESERGVANDRIVLAGFSQGGAIAIHAGVRQAQGLAGIVALSAYLLRAENLVDEMTDAGRATPICQAHGTHDPMVVFERGTRSRDALQAAGCNVEWHDYPMQHQVCDDEIRVVGAFLNRVLG